MTRTMPFGKHKGRAICDLPYDYLEWLVDEDFLKEPLRTRIQEEFDRRQYAQESELTVNVKLLDEIVEAGRRALSKRHHPDIPGGSHRAMVEINNAADWLKQQVRSLAS